jgi:hypothetical protein
MLEDNFKFVESGSVAEDIFSDGELALRSKCISVEQAVGKGITGLEKALEIYKVPQAAYFAYLASNEVRKIDMSVRSESQKEHLISMISVYQEMFLLTFSPILAVAEIIKITSTLSVLSRNIQEDKLTLKENVALK